MTSGNYEILEHTADIGFHAWGATAADLFASAPQALMAIAVEKGVIAGRELMAVEVTGHDYPSLMVNWLDEILYLFDTGRFAPLEFLVDEVTPQFLRARLIGEPRDPKLHPWKLIVKAITYHRIEVAERDGRWEATLFVDV